MYSSFSFRTEQAVLIAMAAMDTIAPLTFLAFSGHCFTQRIQEMHFLAFAAKLGVDRVCSNYASRLRRDFETVKSLDFK